MNFKLIVKYTILLLCLVFVVERTIKCVERFLEKPQAVEIKMSDGTDEILPHFTFCSTDRFNTEVFKNCGLKYRYYDFYALQFLLILLFLKSKVFSVKTFKLGPNGLEKVQNTAKIPNLSWKKLGFI